MGKISIGECLNATSGEIVLGDVKQKVTYFTNSLRRVQEESLYISNEKIENEEEIITHLVKKAASGIMVSTKQTLNFSKWENASLVVIKVENVREAYYLLATLYRKQFTIPIIEVIGSSGKTTTKQMIGKLIRQKMPAVVSESNYNAPLAVANYICSLRGHHKAGIFEVGMRKRGVIAKSSAMLTPTIGVVTSIHRAHLQTLETIEEIIKAKSEIIACMDDKSTLIINHEDENCRKIDLENYKGECIWFGFSDECDIWAEDISYEGLSTKFLIKGKDFSFHCKIHTFGRYNVLNSLAAVAVAMKVGMEHGDIIEGLSAYKPIAGRQEIIQLSNERMAINDTFNANPDSTQKLIEEIPILAKQRPVVLFLGDMENPNSESKYALEVHYQIGLLLGSKSICHIVCIGKWAKEYMRGAIDSGLDKENVSYFETVHTVSLELSNFITPGSYVILKSSQYVVLKELLSQLM